MAASSRSPRRSTEEVRALIIDAATRLFGERGYAETSMRDIAAAAGISLSVLYRQFAGKEELFSATLVTPFLATSKEFVAAWSDQIDDPWSDEQLVREFVRDLYGNLMSHRHSLVTVLAAGETSSSVLLEHMRDKLEESLLEVRRIAEDEADRRQWFTRESVAYSSQLVVALIGGLVLLKPLLDGALADDDEATIDAATQLALYGMRLAPRDATD